MDRELVVRCPNCNETRTVKGLSETAASQLPGYPAATGALRERHCRHCVGHADGMTRDERWRAIQRLRDDAHLSFAEIGERFGKSKGWAYEHYRMALKHRASLLP